MELNYPWPLIWHLWFKGNEDRLDWISPLSQIWHLWFKGNEEFSLWLRLGKERHVYSLRLWPGLLWAAAPAILTGERHSPDRMLRSSASWRKLEKQEMKSL